MALNIQSLRYVSDGETAAYALTGIEAPTNLNILVIVNGLVQLPDTDYYIYEGGIIFNNIPFNGSDIELRHYNVGITGFQGSAGIQGPLGESGFRGSEGIIGRVGFQGSTGNSFVGSEYGVELVFSANQPQNPDANTLWWNTNTCVLYVYYIDGTSDQWVAASPAITDALLEAAGNGYTGSEGAIGYSGSQGIGYTGSAGSGGGSGDGYTGSKGDLGYVGSQGPRGFFGYTGSQGIGYAGSAGSGSGSGDGYTGSRGDLGYVGSQGFTGSIGAGFSGSRGDRGFAGSNGFTGSIGYSGSIGYVGSKGDSGALTEFTLTCSGSVTRTLLNKARDFVNVLDFGADPTGSVDSTTAFQNAMNCLGALGGTVYVPQGKFLILNNLSVGNRTDVNQFNNITIQGPYGLTDRGQTETQVTTMSGILLSASATIRLFQGCGIQGCNIIRNGLEQSSTAPASYSGTAILANFGYGAFVRDCMILGFNQAIYADQVGQIKITDVFIDCTNGVLVNNSVDITYLTRVHCWPFITDPYVGVSGIGINRRAGIAFRLTGINDWTKLTDCFVYGYYRGYQISGGDETHLTGCGSDNTFPSVHAGSIGFLVDGSTSNLTLTNCQAAASQNGFYMNNGAHVKLNGCSAWGIDNNGYIVAAGIATLLNSSARDTPTGITITGGTARAIGFGVSGVTTPVVGTLQSLGTTFSF